MKLIERVKQAIKAFAGFSAGGGFFSISNGAAPRQYVEDNLLHGYAGWAYAAISKRAKRVGAMDWKLYEYTKGGDVSEVFDHEMLRILYRPNPYQSRYEFLYTLEMFICIWGKAPIYIEQMNGRALAIWPLRPDLLSSDKAENGSTRRWIYRVNGDVDYLEKENVFEIREPNPKSISTGFSSLAAAGLEIDTDVAAATWNRNLLENAAESGIVLEMEGELTDEQYKRIKAQWNERQAGPKNAGRTAILENGLKANAVGKSVKDMQLNDTRRFNRGAIVSILGVPEPLLTSENSNLANIEGSERVFNTDTINPEMKLINDAFNEFFVPFFSETLYLDYTSPIAENVTDKINEALAGEGRWMTVNEARALFNLPPLNDGDAVYKPMGLEPVVSGEKSRNNGHVKRLDAKGLTYSNPKHEHIKRYILARTKARRDFNEKVAEKAAQTIVDLISQKGKVVLKVKGPESKKKDFTDPEGEDLHPKIKAERIEFLKALPKYKKKYQDQLKKFFRELMDETLANLETEGLPKSRKANSNWVSRLLFDREKANAALVTISGAVWRENITRGANSVAGLLGFEAVHEFTTPFVTDYIAEREIKIKIVTKTTEDALRLALTEGITAGDSVGQIRARIEDVFGIAQSVRSETIARTEVASAQNFGRLEEMRIAGAKNKIWIAIFNNTRDDHGEAHGQVVHTDEPFNVGGEDLQFPGDPSGSPWNVINCQCSASPTLDDVTQ